MPPQPGPWHVFPQITGLPQSLTHRSPPLTYTLSTCSIYSLDTEEKKCYRLTNYCNYHSNYQVVSTHPLQLALFYFASITSYTASFRGRVLWRISAPTLKALLPSVLRRGDGDTVTLQLHLKKTILLQAAKSVSKSSLQEHKLEHLWPPVTPLFVGSPYDQQPPPKGNSLQLVWHAESNLGCRFKQQRGQTT